MADASKVTATPVLDEWVAEVGEDGVAAVARDLAAAVEAGTAPVIRDGSALRKYWDDRHQAG